MSDPTVQPPRTPPSGSTPAGEIPEVDYVALQPGQLIGRYEIVSVLGQGGFGITYRARDIQLGREVAIKEYLPTALAVRQDGTTVLPRTTKMADDFGWGRERFVTEGRTLASLHRVPAIVQVFDFLEANGTAYIVMELLHGETLEARITRLGKLGPEDVDRILWPLLDGLEKVHDAGFLHRDIKPANILLDDAGNPTLIDFGASRAAMAGRSVALTAIFTPGYAAAEQMTSAKQGPWTDIYGLSATLYHAIAGQTPPSAFDRMLDDAYQPLAQLNPPGFARGVLAGVDAGLAVAARDRPQSIAGWRPILGMSVAPEADSTVVMGKALKRDPTGDTSRPFRRRPPKEPAARVASAYGSESPSCCSPCWAAAVTTPSHRVGRIPRWSRHARRQKRPKPSGSRPKRRLRNCVPRASSARRPSRPPPHSSSSRRPKRSPRSSSKTRHAARSRPRSPRKNAPTRKPDARPTRRLRLVARRSMTPARPSSSWPGRSIILARR